ncbi:outer envelope membrane protein 7 [Cynara cardunculus var. scolymus]|uniref:Outer envelope membrane protein 7 n=1 Tax=Cynara cardunculus var. scolymus TaxID=59895 RepID=A0A103XEW0_CYNCS|nr:outer envelope membrane protein 7 [Cynara cardunculus var. scolymus]KVH89384.1 hypothetical protein Ccrd_008624 [Cynara cardunculus var. scolymus]
MGALTASLIAIVGLALGWITIEIACKPCLEQGREAIDRNLNPDYDPDDDDPTLPLNPNPLPSDHNVSADSSSTVAKIV